MTNNKLGFPDSDEENLFYRRNSLNSNQEHEESDQEQQEIISYFVDKILSLENSFYQRNFQDEISARDKDFLIDLIKTLFKEVSDINDNSLKIYTRNLHKTDMINKITTIHKELLEKYIGLKMNYKSVIKQEEYKEKQISDLEALIKACDLEIYELKSKINQMKNNLSKSSDIYSYDINKNNNNNNGLISNEIQEMLLHHDKEKEDLNLIIDNLRNNLIRRENFSHDLKAEIKTKSFRINEVSKEIERYKHDFEKCKINLELEKKFHTEKAEELKYLTESFLFTRKKEYKSDLEEDEEQSDSSKECKKIRKKNSRARLYSHRLIKNIKFDQERDFSYMKRSSLYINSDSVSKNNPEHKIVKSISYFTPHIDKEDILEVNSFSIDSEPSLVNVSILEKSQSSDSVLSNSAHIRSISVKNASSNQAVLETQEPSINNPQALDCIMSVNEGSVTDNKIETMSNLQPRYKKNTRIAITKSMEFVEQGLITAKNKLNTENIFHSTNRFLDVQSVSNLNFICHKKKSKKKKEIKFSSSNCNIINLNFNNFEMKNFEDFQSDNSQSRSIRTECNYDKLLSEDFYQMIFEKIKNWNGDVREVRNLQKVMDNEKVFLKNEKLLAKENNFYSFIDLYFSELIYLIYFFYNAHVLII